MSKQPSNQSEPFVWSDLRKRISTNRNAKNKEVKHYEKEYLTRYKKRQKPKSKIKKSKPLEVSDDDLGRLNLRKHVVTKREKLQAERKEYERQYLARYLKQQKTKPKKKK